MRMLREGSTGAAVDLLQLALHRAGAAVAVDGMFGSGTAATLRVFQTDHGCVADGIAGACTWAALTPYLLNPDGPIVPTQVRWSSQLLCLVIDGLRARYPFLRVRSIGKSVLCRPLYQISIGCGRKCVGYNAAHHANEWITTPLVMKFLEDYAEGVARGGKLGGADCQKLYRDYTLDLVPMVNPDG